MLLGVLLSRLESVQTPVSDLDDPVTVNHTSSGGQVAMEFNGSVMEILHSLKTVTMSGGITFNNYSPLTTDTEVNSCFSIY